MSRRTRVIGEQRRRRHHPFVAAFAVAALALFGAVIPATSASAVGGFEGRLVDELGQPAVGVTVELRSGGVATDLTTDGAGVFGATGLADGAYEAFVPEGALGDGGERFTISSTHFTIVDGVALLPLGDIVVYRYRPVSGEISNWSSAMGDVRVTLWWKAPGGWGPLNISPRPNWVTSTDGQFTISAPIYGGDYTLYFQMDEETSPYVDAFLGGAYDDPEAATKVPSDVGTAITGITAEMADAAVITGRVTANGGPLAGIEVEAWSEEHGEYAYAETDATGTYTIYVRPGTDYEVYTWGDADYAGMTYDGWDSCGCEFDPVATTVADPAEGIDFDLIEYAGALEVLGVAADEDSEPIEDLDVRLFRASGGVWVLHDVVESDGGVPNFGFLLGTGGVHRVQFVDDDGHILRVTDGVISDFVNPTVALDPLPACYADLGDVQDSLLVAAVLDPATAAGACASLEGTSVVTAPSGGTGSPGVVVRPQPSTGSARPITKPFARCNPN